MSKYAVRDVVDMVVKTPKWKWSLNIDLAKQLFDDLNNFSYSKQYLLDLNKDIDETVRIYYVPSATWSDGDSWVGLSVLYFQDEPYAVISQTHQYAHFNYFFRDQKSYERVIQFFIDLADPFRPSEVEVESIDSFLDDGWFKEFADNPEDYIELERLW